MDTQDNIIKIETRLSIVEKIIFMRVTERADPQHADMVLKDIDGEAKLCIYHAKDRKWLVYHDLNIDQLRNIRDGAW